MTKFKVNNDFINARLDRWFKKNVSDVPQSLIEKNLRKGNIKINNKNVKSSYKLKLEDEIFINNLTFKSSPYKKKVNKYLPTKKETYYSSSMIIENNENFVVINKPAGIAVQSGTKSKRNIIDMLRATTEFKDTIPYTVHRIDKETTGVMLVAKNRKYAQLLTSLFRIRKIHKTYLCIVLGEFSSKKGSIKDNLFHYEDDKKIITKALTHFQLLDSNNNYSLLKLNPETGRKHQLRKHLLLHGHPILGDSKYRLKKNKKSNKNTLMLHASKINFSIDGVKFNFTADIPDVFRNTLKEKYLKIY
jgi:23S rRNA pseudouridine955/2504/2580 synthase